MHSVMVHCVILLGFSFCLTQSLFSLFFQQAPNNHHRKPVPLEPSHLSFQSDFTAFIAPFMTVCILFIIAIL